MRSGQIPLWLRIARPALLLLAASCPPAAQALEIALSNDDGWQAPGIQAVFAALTQAGHQVTLAAPAADQSGGSMALSMVPLRIRREADHQYSVRACRAADCAESDAARPATSSLVAVALARQRRAGQPPDLLVSGVNAGANAGGALVASGTVGAALAAAIEPLGDLPAIAISTDVPESCEGRAACVRAHYDEVAAYLLRLIDQLERHRQRAHAAALLPPRVVLNVNYPAGTPKGVRLVAQARGMASRGRAMRFELSCADCAALEPGSEAAASVLPAAAQAPAPGSGTDLFELAAGYITIEPIEADLTSRASRQFAWLDRTPAR